MRGVLQDDVTAESGNALQACVASILELELHEVPNFIEAPSYLDAISAFLRPLGMTFLKVPLINGTLPFEIGTALCVIAGTSPRGTFKHAVVGKAIGRECHLLHDPHESGDGIRGAPVWVGFFVVGNPASRL
jgi:hypothetical protein